MPEPGRYALVLWLRRLDWNKGDEAERLPEWQPFCYFWSKKCKNGIFSAFLELEWFTVKQKISYNL